LTEKGVFKVAQFNGVIRIDQSPALVAMVTKFGNVNTKLPIIQLIYELWPKIFHQTELFRVALFNSLTEIYQRPTLVAMVTKIWEF